MLYQYEGTISDEIEVNVPSNVAWELYGTLHLSRFIVQEMPTLLNKVDVIEGDGSTATVLKIIFPEGQHNQSILELMFIEEMISYVHLQYE